MSKAKEVISLIEAAKSSGFSADADKWFDKLAFVSKMEKMPEKLVKLANDIHDDVLKPTEAGLKKFSTVINSISGDVLDGLKAQVENINKGKYRREFKKVYGEHSQVSELFSFFEQAALYYENMGPINKDDDED